MQIKEEEAYQKLTQDVLISWKTQLGQGQFGSVFRGYYLKQKKIIAVKFVKPSFLKYKTIRREQTVMEKLAKYKHKNIMGYYGHHQDKRGLFLFLQYCARDSLNNLIKKDKKINELDCIKYLKQMLSGLVYLHEQNIIHRDLKPDNILLNQNFQVKIADFGLSRDIQVHMSAGIGTPIYSAPQVVRQNQSYDEKSDVWSLGIVLYQMLQGNQLFGNVVSKKQLIKQIQSLQSKYIKSYYPPELDKQWNEITAKMLAINPKNRATFKQIQIYLNKVQEQMKSRIQIKMGYKNNQLKQLENCMKLNHELSPYTQGLGISNPQQNIQQKFAEEESFRKFQDLLSYSVFFKYKSSIMLRLLTHFPKAPYNHCQNLYKYILMFLSICMYLTRLKKYVSLLSKYQIPLPDKTISESQFHIKHQNPVKEKIKQFISFFNEDIVRVTNTLINEVINVITKKYLCRQQEQKILEDLKQNNNLDMKQLMENVKLGQYTTYDNYLTLYKSITDLQNIHLTENQFNQLPKQQLKIYTFMRIIRQLDKVIEDKKYQNPNYIKNKYQNLQQLSQKSMKEYLKDLN